MRWTKGLEEEWEGASGCDIISARSLVLFQHPSTDRSSIVPACVGSQGSHVLEIIHPRAAADGGSRL